MKRATKSTYKIQPLPTLKAGPAYHIYLQNEVGWFIWWDVASSPAAAHAHVKKWFADNFRPVPTFSN